MPGEFHGTTCNLDVIHPDAGKEIIRRTSREGKNPHYPGGISRRTGVSARFLKEIEATEVPAGAKRRPYPPERGWLLCNRGLREYMQQAPACCI